MPEINVDNLFQRPLNSIGYWVPVAVVNALIMIAGETMLYQQRVKTKIKDDSLKSGNSKIRNVFLLWIILYHIIEALKYKLVLTWLYSSWEGKTTCLRRCPFPVVVLDWGAVNVTSQAVFITRKQIAKICFCLDHDDDLSWTRKVHSFSFFMLYRGQYSYLACPAHDITAWVGER